MKKSLQTVFEYHETTKHAKNRFARSNGYLDWDTQPEAFRTYSGVKTIKLPLAMDNTTPPYHLLDDNLPSAPLVIESISQLLQFSMGIAAWKESGGSSWAVRCNASSGNLHPTEAYLILPPVLKEQEAKSALYHYSPKHHALETLCEFETLFWDDLPKGSFLIALSSITWREVWKYGERAFRYTQLDAGHAWQSFVVSAKMLGWRVTRVDNLSSDDMSILLGLGQENRFFESENPDMFFVVSPDKANPVQNLEKLVGDMPLKFEGIANQLSESMQDWEIIPAIEQATTDSEIPQKEQEQSRVKRSPTQESKDVVLNRRSVHYMKKDISQITKVEFHNILKSVALSQDAKENSAHLALFLHRVEDYESGLYILIRNERDKKGLQEQMHQNFQWRETELENLYFLESKDFTIHSREISCNQYIASNGAFTLGMLCNFSQQLQEHGAHRYKELYWECGAIGQQLYLEATSMGLSGTGIGCFLDDDMHQVLGVQDNRFQVLYHFTVGRGSVDSRILTKPAYINR